MPELQRLPMAGGDVMVTVHLEFLEAALGKERLIEVPMRARPMLAKSTSGRHCKTAWHTTAVH